jgi:RNA polymerase sigma-70 factor (ECF subfamily)
LERAELRRLMERLADGDRAAFGPAFAMLWPQLRAFAGRLVGATDGEDAAQVALLRIFARASEYDRSRDALAWALGIAAWECRTLRRKRERRREGSALAPAVDGAAAAGPSPEETLIDGDLRAAAAEVLGTLRPLDVETILAIAGGERPVEGATFRKRVERAMARFRLAWRARHGNE